MLFQKETRIAVAIGAAAGIVNGLFGAGGGLLLVPLLITACHLPPKAAFATSLAVMLALSAVSFTVYLFRGSVDFAAALPYAVGGIAGGVLAGIFMKRMRVLWLRVFLAAFLLYGGVKAVMLW